MFWKSAATIVFTLAFSLFFSLFCVWVYVHAHTHTGSAIVVFGASVLSLVDSNTIFGNTCNVKGPMFTETTAAGESSATEIEVAMWNRYLEEVLFGGAQGGDDGIQSYLEDLSSCWLPIGTNVTWGGAAVLQV